MLSQRLRLARQAKKLTQEELAKRVNTKKTTISNYETGYSTPSNEMLKDLAGILGVSSDYLLGLADNAWNNVDDLNPNRFIEIANIAKQGEGVKQQTAAYDPLMDPELNLFFKDFAKAPEQMKQEMLEFWEFVKSKEKNRKPGDKQGE